LSTIIDPRFKLSPYLPNERHLEYTNWLIEEAEKVSGIRVRLTFIEFSYFQI